MAGSFESDQRNQQNTANENSTIHRFARGNSFYETGQRQAKAKGIKLEWTLATAPGIGHSDRGMSTPAADLLFGNR